MVNLPEIIEKFPAITPRESDSIIFRFIEAFQDDANEFGDDLDDILESRFIDQATGGDLDRIGAMYGPLGTRAGRDDDEYRKYLKSLVPVFQYRGTVPGIKEAVAAGLDIESGINGDSAAPAELDVYEHFNDDPANPEEYLEYTIILEEWPEHRGSTVEELAELSDASVSRLRKTRYDVENEKLGIADVVSFTEGQLASDDVTIDDAIAANRRAFTDTTAIADANAINANKFGPFADTAFVNDANAVDANKFTSSDEASVDDDAESNRGSATEDISSTDTIENVEPVNKNSHRWEETSDTEVTTEWNFFEWTEIVDLVEPVTDTAFVDDVVTIPPKDAVTSDTFFSNDEVVVTFNETQIDEVVGTDDVVTIPPAEQTTDIGGSDDAVVSSQTFVGWDTNDWDTLEWVQEHN